MATGTRSKKATLAQTLSTFLAKTLVPDLRARVDASPSVQRALAHALERERREGRTADDALGFRDRLLEQVGAAWLLGCVFVRFLEDRGLVPQRRLAGEGATDSEERFGEALPGLRGNAREYLLCVLRECGRLPGAREVLGPRNNAAYRLGPSVEVAAALLRLLRERDEHNELRWRFDSDDTRVLGDLYQDLSDSVRERYALLQTPHFVEEFILEHTLDPAVKEFGLEGLRVLDPTCGSGHFLLGAFERLRALHQKRDPGGDPRTWARDALGHVFGVDLNPYAVAITRFRLLVAYVRAAGIAQLSEAPTELALDKRVVVADSLLYGGKGETLTFAERAESNEERRKWAGGERFALEDPAAAKVLFGQGYHAVVGNPPYITCKDEALRKTYQDRYPDSAVGKYALAAPFTERFFELGEKGGFVGLINANSFLKREFGKGLIEKVLPRVELSCVADTSGAFIPGHGTPTVLLFGRNRAPSRAPVRAVMGKRGEPETPEDAARGRVWVSIVAAMAVGEEEGFENEFVSLARIDWATLAKHPWSLGGGGARELKELIERACAKRLGEVTSAIGFASFTGTDEVFLLPPAAFARVGVPGELVRPIIVGESVRDWCTSPNREAFVPYDRTSHRPISFDPSTRYAHALWPFRAVVGAVLSFGGKTRSETGEPWWQWYRWQTDRYLVPLTITFAFVATHNHFVLDRGGKVFKQTAPVIKLPEGATEDEHLALLAWLNSSTACFWMKQVIQAKTVVAGDKVLQSNLDKIAYEFAGTPLAKLPVPAFKDRDLWAAASRSIELAAEERGRLARETVADIVANSEASSRLVAETEQRDQLLFRRMIALQEAIDLLAYCELELIEDALAAESLRLVREVIGGDATIALGDRSFEGGHTHELTRALSAARASVSVGQIEHPAYKRPWLGVLGRFQGEKRTWREGLRAEAIDWVAQLIEAKIAKHDAPVSSVALLRNITSDPRVMRLASVVLGLDYDGLLLHLNHALEADAIPFLTAARFTAEGLEKRALWESTWALQRREDAGEALAAPIPVPPKYDSTDYRAQSFWSLRGRLDVPRERFISYPLCTTDEDPSPLYGWAGWDHKQRADALTALYQRRKTDEGWGAERLLPLLAGLTELLPWLAQWHNAPSEGEDQGAGDAYAAFVASEARELGVTLDALRAWRPAEKERATRAAKAPAVKALVSEGEAPAMAPKKRGRPKKAAEPA